MLLCEAGGGRFPLDLFCSFAILTACVTKGMVGKRFGRAGGRQKDKNERDEPGASNNGDEPAENPWKSLTVPWP